MLGADPFGPRDTITVRDSHPSPVARYRGRPHYRISWHALPSCSARRRCGRARASRSSSFKRPGWTGSGFTAFCNKRGSRAMWSIRPRSQYRAGGGGPRPTRSTGRLCCGRFWPISAARVCSMVVAPSAEEEDQRRLCRERDTLTTERVRHVNRIKGLLFAQGIGDYEPVSRNRRKRLDQLCTGDGRPLPQYVKAQIRRELDRLELVLEQINVVEKERDRVLLSPPPVATINTGTEAACDKPRGSGVAMLTALRGFGADSATKLWSEGLSRHFSNRRQVAAYTGLAPTPWQSGGIAHEQGVSKAGNPRLRTTMVQIAWLWLRHQPQSALARWYFARVGVGATKARKKVAITALARKLLVALWKYVTAGELVEGAIMNPVA